jgi:hypothetical protein
MLVEKDDECVTVNVCDSEKENDCVMLRLSELVSVGGE